MSEQVVQRVPGIGKATGEYPTRPMVYRQLVAGLQHTLVTGWRW